MEPSQTDGPVPSWVDDLVDDLVRIYMVVAGPAGIVLLGRLGQESGEARWVWRSAADMEESVFGRTEWQIVGPYKGAIMSRLRRNARARAKTAPFHPHTTSGIVTYDKLRHGWFHQDTEGNETFLVADGQNYLVTAHKISNWGATVRLGLSPAGGNWLRVLGVLADGDVAYCQVADEPQALVIPCGRGGQRDVIMVVQQDEGLDVLGFNMRRSPAVDSVRPVFGPYGGKAKQSYFAMWNTENGKKKLRVLKLPD